MSNRRLLGCAAGRLVVFVNGIVVFQPLFAVKRAIAVCAVYKTDGCPLFPFS